MNNIKKSLSFVIICILFVGIQVVFAGENFQNNLLKTDVRKNSLGAVKVTLYTNKPYHDSVVANKKSDYEYVILMPETSNSLTAKPTFQAASDVVRNIEVKTQQYTNGVKGYTKIVVSTTKPIEIVPQVQTLSSSHYSVNENDYKELLAQTSKKSSRYSKRISKRNSSNSKNIIASAKTTEVINKLKPSRKTEESKVITRKIISNQKSSETLLKKSKKTQTAQIKPKVVAPKVEKMKPTVAETEQAAPVQPKPMVTKTEAPQGTGQVAKAPTIQNGIDNSANKMEPVSQVAPVKTVEAVAPAAMHTGRFQKYKKIIKNNIYILLGAVSSVFILLLLMARVMTRNIKKHKENFAAHLDEKPLKATDYTEKINEDMTWKEKFQTYVDTSNAQEQEENIDINVVQPNEELDDLFSEEFSSPSYTQSLPDAEVCKGDFSVEVEESPDELDEFINTDSLGFGEAASVDDLFGDDESYGTSASVIEAESKSYSEPVIDKVVQKTSEPEIIEESNEIVKSEFIIDDGKGFYLVDFQDTTVLVGHINDEIFVLKRFNKKIEAPLQARIDERKTNSVSYMTKVGNFKGLVEVTPQKMNLLIEL